MQRIKKYGKRVYTVIENPMDDLLQDYCKEKGLYRSNAIERILQHYFYWYYCEKGNTNSSINKSQKNDNEYE